MIQIREVDVQELIYLRNQLFIQTLIQVNNNEDFQKVINYIKKHLSALYLSYLEKDGKIYLQLDKNFDISKQIIVHNCKVPSNFREFRKEYQIIDRFRCGELHIFDDYTLVLMTQHAITDGRYLQKFLDDIVYNTPREIELPDHIPVIFKEELEIHKKYLAQGAYDPKYLNKYEIIDDFYDEPIVEQLTIDMDNYPELQHYFTQKLIIMHSLLKLYILQRQGRINDISKELSDGMAFMQQYVTDARKFTTKKWAYGSCYLAFDDNYVIKSDIKISDIAEQLRQSMKELQDNYEQYSFIQHHVNMNKQEPVKKNYNLVHSIFFSNAGKFANHDMYKRVDFECLNNKKQINNLMSILYSFKNILSISYHNPKCFAEYHLMDVMQTLMNNIRDNITVGELWNKIKYY